jgi:hypothetical protein
MTTTKRIVLPSLAWDGDFWTGTVRLPSWRGFQSRGGPCASRDRMKPSTGVVELSLAPPAGEEIEGARPPAPEQLSAYWYLLDHEPALFQAVHKAAFKYHQRCRKGGWRDEKEKPLPALKGPAELRRHIGMGTVHLLPVAKGGLGYIGFELGCSWDREHGLGVMTHKGRVVEFGGADTSFLEWIAERDGGELLELAKPAKPVARKRSKSKRR